MTPGAHHAAPGVSTCDRNQIREPLACRHAQGPNAASGLGRAPGDRFFLLYYVSLYTALLARPWTRCRGHTRQRDVWAGEAEARVRALHNTHGTAGSRRADCRRLNLHRLLSGNEYIAHCERRPARYPPPGWRRATTVKAPAAGPARWVTSQQCTVGTHPQ